jgi:uncharacterized protein (TIGR03435 family)
MRTLLITGLAIASLTSQVPIKAQEKELAFDVTSVKPNADGPEGLLVLPGGTLEMMNMPIASLVAYAYGVRTSEIDKLPSWATRDGYTIRATTTAKPTAAQTAAMIRSLLRDRFQLSVHAEQRPIAVYALVPARNPMKLGPGLKGRTQPCVRGEKIKIEGSNEDVSCGGFLSGGDSLKAANLTMSAFAQLLGNLLLFRRVVDRTELQGPFDISLHFVKDAAAGPTGAAGDGIGLPPLSAALEEQLGLRVESRQEPSNVVVVDRIERPQPD